MKSFAGFFVAYFVCRLAFGAQSVTYLITYELFYFICMS